MPPAQLKEVYYARLAEAHLGLQIQPKQSPIKPVRFTILQLDHDSSQHPGRSSSSAVVVGGVRFTQSRLLAASLFRGVASARSADS